MLTSSVFSTKNILDLTIYFRLVLYIFVHIDFMGLMIKDDLFC